MKATAIDIKNQTLNRILIVSLHIVGWISFISLPFMFLGPGRGGPGERPGNFRPPPPRDMHMPQPSELDFYTMRLHSVLFNVLLIGFFYLNMYILIPRVLTRKSWLHYLGSVVACFVIIALASELINYLLSAYAFRPGRPFYFTMLNFLLVFGLSTALRLTRDRVQFERERKERENETLKSELSLLRSQVSPHFMFNVLNNLASLARKKSDQLESVIIQLSHLMRYMLYETGEKRVTLEKEIEYVKSYIDLQKLRFGNDVSIDFNSHVNAADQPIEPMLLIPFVENAFKHGLGLIKDPEIIVRISMEEDTLNFVVKNKFNHGLLETKDPSSGIGIQNVRRRLELLYKDLHELKIFEEGQWFVVELKIILR